MIKRIIKGLPYFFLFALVLGVFTVLVHTAFINSTPGIDLFVFWSAGRAFFNHQDPYSQEVSAQIQMAIYRHLALPGQDHMEFAYPPYALLVLYPILWFTFDWTQAIWMSFNLLVLVSLAYLLFPNAPKWLSLTLPVFYPVVFGLILGNFVVLLSAILLIFLRILLLKIPLSHKAQFFLGGLMAWTTIKPQYTWLFLVLFLLYCCRQRMMTMITGFIAALSGLALLSFLFLPNWPILWIRELGAYQEYNRPVPVLSEYLAYLFPPNIVQPLFYLAALAGAAVTAFMFLRWWKGQLADLYLISWCSFFTFIVHINTVSYEQIILLLPFFLWAVTQKPTPRLMTLWTGAWITSYALFAISFLKILPNIIDTAPFLLYSVWILWLFATAPKAQQPVCALNA